MADGGDRDSHPKEAMGPDTIQPPGSAQLGIIKPFTIGRTLWHGFGAFFYGIVPITVTALVLLTPVAVFGWLSAINAVQGIALSVAIRDWLTSGGPGNADLLSPGLTRQLISFALKIFVGYFYVLASAMISNVVIRRFRGEPQATIHTIAELPAIALSALGLTVSLGIIFGSLKILLDLPGPYWIGGALVLIVMILFLAIVIMLLVLFFVVIPAIAVDTPGFRTGLYHGYSRSLLLTRGNRWRIFGLLIVLLFMLGVIVLAMPLTATAVVLWVDPKPPPKFTDIITSLEFVAIGLISSSLAIGFMTSFVAVAYDLLRIERDGPPTDTLAALFE